MSPELSEVRSQEHRGVGREEDCYKNGAADLIGPRGNIMVIWPVAQQVDAAQPPQFIRPGPD